MKNKKKPRLVSVFFIYSTYLSLCSSSICCISSSVNLSHIELRDSLIPSRVGQRITQYELSKDGKQVTMINRRPIAEVVEEEFPEGE